MQGCTCVWWRAPRQRHILQCYRIVPYEVGWLAGLHIVARRPEARLPRQPPDLSPKRGVGGRGRGGGDVAFVDLFSGWVASRLRV